MANTQLSVQAQSYLIVLFEFNLAACEAEP